MTATEQECKVVLDTYGGQHCEIVGFSTQKVEFSGEWGAPYYIRNLTLPPGEQVIWRGDSQDEMFERCEIERMRVALDALASLKCSQ
ncbi:MAG: hypothetical protein JWL86_5446 [Rhizobium sp.]|nr:hypothetical protein [Rhizobium sp.]